MFKKSVAVLLLVTGINAQDIRQENPVIIRHDQVEKPKHRHGPVWHIKNLFRKKENPVSPEVSEPAEPVIMKRSRTSSYIRLTPEGETFKNKWLMRKLHLDKPLTAEERNYLISMHRNSEINPILWYETYDSKLLTAWQEYENKRTRGVMFWDDYLSGQVSMDDLLNSTYDKLISGQELSENETEHVRELGGHIQADPSAALGSLDLRVWNMWVRQNRI